MQRYSVLLVDDEEDVIQVIMKKIDWESMGFQVSGYAHNGVEALEMAEECCPDGYQDAVYGWARHEPEAQGTIPEYKNHHLFRV